VYTLAHQYFSCITTLHCVAPNFSVRTRIPIFFHAMPLYTAQRQILARAPARQCFSTQCHSALCNAKFYHVHLHVNIFPCNATLHRAVPNFSACTCTPIFFHAIPLCTTQRQILVCAPARQYFSTYHKLFTMHHAFLVCTPTHIHFYALQFLVNFAAEIGILPNIFLIFAIDILQL
jgi:hypothetical protein